MGSSQFTLAHLTRYRETDASYRFVVEQAVGGTTSRYGGLVTLIRPAAPIANHQRRIWKRMRSE